MDLDNLALVRQVEEMSIMKCVLYILYMDPLYIDHVFTYIQIASLTAFGSFLCLLLDRCVDGCVCAHSTVTIL